MSIAGSFPGLLSSIPLPIAEVTAEQTRRACGEEPGFWCREVYELTEDRTVADLADALIGTPLAIIAILLGAIIVNRLVRRTLKSGLRRLGSGAVTERVGSAVRKRTPEALLETRETSLRAEQRIDALSGVLRSVASFIIFLIAGFLILGRVGVNLAPLLAGAGIVGVALGFGSQRLVQDFLSGIFILIEDQYGVGDIVDLDTETSGTVEAISLRTTRLRSVDGTVWHVPNGEIRRVGNMSQHWSRSLVDVEVAYNTDIGYAREVIEEVANRHWKENPDVLEEPEVWGVEALGSSGITIRLVVKTTPSKQWGISRTLRKEIKEAFDEVGIEIPFPQQVVWHHAPPQANGNGGAPAAEGHAAAEGEKPASPAPASAPVSAPKRGRAEAPPPARDDDGGDGDGGGDGASR